jgi:molybdate transport system substrate-binding protein
MSLPLVEAAKVYEKKTGVKIEFSFGDSAQVLPSIELGQKGDMFIVHDPFMNDIEKKGLVEASRDVALMRPVLVVLKGNPKNINKLEDLALEGIKIGCGDVRFSRAGKLTEEYLAKRKLLDKISKNIKFRARGSSELSSAVKLKTLDAAFVWNASAYQFKDALDVAALKDVFPAIKVSAGVLKRSAAINVSKDFLEFLASKEGAKIFTDFGFAKE